MDDLLQDIRYAARQLRKAPAFTLVAVLTLGIGIGANTAIFSVVNGVLLRPLAYRDPGRLYLIQEIVPQMTKFYPLLSANLPDFRIWQKECHSFTGIAIAEPATADMSGEGEAQQLHGVRSSANLFDVLGVRPALGRSFLPEEDEPGRGHVVVITDRFFRNYFRGNSEVIGQQIKLDGEQYFIAGVLPASFHFPAHLGWLSSFGQELDFFEPLNGPRFYEQGLVSEFDFAAIGRLKPDVTPDRALAELNVVQAQIAQTAKEGVDLKASLSPLDTEVVGSARLGLILLLAAVAAVLLIVCFNLANLLLARVPSRMREEAIRAALGASKWRLFRRTLIESLLLGVVGGILGIVIGELGLKWLLLVAPSGIPRLDEVQVDARALGFAILLSLATSVLFGVLPAWKMARSNPQNSLKWGSAAAGENRHARRVRSGLIGLEVGISTVLLITAGLLTASLVRLLRVDGGFQTDHVLTANIDLPSQAYKDPDTRLHFYNALLDRIRALPGVSSAGWVSMLPLAGERSATGIDVPAGQQVSHPTANYRPISPDYFKTMGIPLLRGRIFNESDRGRKVVVISESVARRFWPGHNPIGRTCLTYWGPEEADEVIGVVGDIHTVRLDAPPLMMVYVPDWFGSLHLAVPQSAAIVVSTASDERILTSAVRQAIHATDREVPIVDMRPMGDLLSESVAPRRFQMFLLQLFAACALLIASLGIYGVISYSVEQRRHELGIRAALGAGFSDLRSMILRQGMTPVIFGLFTGVVASILSGRLLQNLLFGITVLHPLTLFVVTALVSAVAVAACLIPSRRATSVDPMVALRYE
ncbi:MAG TPA: ABC transporter permease [Terriglobales bacterium]|nr:ABC transporter permease [Terriglobales bacterium]